MKNYLLKEMYEMEESYWWHRAKRDYIHNLLSKKLGSKQKPKILDVGCGTGFFLKELGRTYDAWGLDSSRTCLSYSKKREIKNLTLIDIEKSTFPRIRFDAATALDVVEHIEDDSQALKNIGKSLKKDGILIVAVPAFASLWTYWDELAGHRRRYSKKSLEKLLKKAGFRVEFIRYSNILPFFPAVILRAIRSTFKNSSNKVVSDFVKVSDPINDLLYYLMRIEEKITTYLPIPFGLSLIAVGRKVSRK